MKRTQPGQQEVNMGLVLFPVGKTLNEFRALFHNGQVGGKVGVEHIVKAQCL